MHEAADPVARASEGSAEVGAGEGGRVMTANEPREFLSALAGKGWLARIAANLEHMGIDILTLSEEDPESASTVLCHCLVMRALEPMEAKCLAYVLGQLGFRHSRPVLQKLLSSHPAQGVRNAAAAALSAIREAPADEGHSELQRRVIIDRVVLPSPPRHA